MFNLRFFVEDSGFAEELIAQDGMQILLELVNNEVNRNIQVNTRVKK